MFTVKQAGLEIGGRKARQVAVTIHGEVAPTIAEAINAVYCKKGVERR